MVVYDHDANAILTEPLKSKSGAEHLTALKKACAFLNRKGTHQKIHMMDNECSQNVKDFIKEAQGIELLLVPPHMHRVNAAEKAIDTLKSRFIAGLCAFDPVFPMHLWCQLLPLATIALNLMRHSRINPNFSAHELLYGSLNCNKTPLAPPGCKVVVHDPPSVRKIWDPKGVDSWHVGLAPDHCRCHKAHVPKTRAEKVAKTVRFFPHKASLPENNANEQLLESACKLSNTLQSKKLNNLPYSSPDTATAIKKLAETFLNKIKMCSTQSTAPPRVKEAMAPKQTEEPMSDARVESKKPTAKLTAPHAPKPHAMPEAPREKRARMRNQNKDFTSPFAPSDETSTDSVHMTPPDDCKCNQIKIKKIW